MRRTIRIIVLVFLFDAYVRTMVEGLKEREICNTYVLWCKCNRSRISRDFFCTCGTYAPYGTLCTQYVSTRGTYKNSVLRSTKVVKIVALITFKRNFLPDFFSRKCNPKFVRSNQIRTSTNIFTM